MKQNSKVRIETGGGGSGAGVQQCVAGTVDIGAISSDFGRATEETACFYAINLSARYLLIAISPE